MPGIPTLLDLYVVVASHTEKPRVCQRCHLEKVIRQMIEEPYNWEEKDDVLRFAVRRKSIVVPDLPPDDGWWTLTQVQTPIEADYCKEESDEQV